MFILSSVDRHLNGFCFLATRNNVTLDCVQVIEWTYIFSSCRFLSRIEIFESDDSCMFNFLRTSKLFSTVLYIFTFLLAILSVLILHIFTNTVFASFLHFNYSCVGEVVSYCRFDEHFPNDYLCWASFLVLIGYLYIFFREIII